MAQELFSTSLFSDANLQSYYRAESTADAKGSNTLTNNNSVAFSAAKFNNGFDGGATNTNKWMSVANKINYGGGAYSISLWFKATTEIGSGTYDLFELQDSVSHTTLLLAYDYNGGTRRLQFTRVRLGVAGDTLNSTQTLGNSVFHNIVFSYDGSTITGYLDNVSLGTQASSGSGSSGGTDGFEILTDRNLGAGNLTSGIIDDVALFNRALTPVEISTIYNGSVSGGGAFLEEFV